MLNRQDLLNAAAHSYNKGDDKDGDEKSASDSDSSSSEILVNKRSRSKPKKVPTPTAPVVGVPTISDIGLTLAYNDQKRNDFRTLISKRIACGFYKLERTPERDSILPARAPLPPTKFNQPTVPDNDEIIAPLRFEENLDYVSRLCGNRSMGFNLDELMEAIYGPISKSAKRLQSEANKNLDGDALPVDQSVCYFKRLSDTARYTSMSIARIAPPIETTYLKSDGRSVAGSASGENVIAKFGERILPIYLLPQFLISQRIQVQKNNNVLALCFNLLRDMERFARAFGTDRLYIYSLQQLRANFNHVLSDVNVRAISASEFVQRLGKLEQEHQRQRESMYKISKTLGLLVDTLVVTEDDIKNNFMNKFGTLVQQQHQQPAQPPSATKKASTPKRKRSSSGATSNTTEGEGITDPSLRKKQATIESSFKTGSTSAAKPTVTLAQAIKKKLSATDNELVSSDAIRPINRASHTTASRVINQLKLDSSNEEEEEEDEEEGEGADEMNIEETHPGVESDDESLMKLDSASEDDD